MLVLRGCTFIKSKCFVVLMLVITVEIITGKRLFQNWGKSSRNGLIFDSSKLGYYAKLICTVSNCWWFRADLLRISRCLPPSFFFINFFKSFVIVVSRVFCVHFHADKVFVPSLWGLACFTELSRWLSQAKLISNELQ